MKLCRSGLDGIYIKKHFFVGHFNSEMTFEVGPKSNKPAYQISHHLVQAQAQKSTFLKSYLFSRHPVYTQSKLFPHQYNLFQWICTDLHDKESKKNIFFLCILYLNTHSIDSFRAYFYAFCLFFCSKTKELNTYAVFCTQDTHIYEERSVACIHKRKYIFFSSTNH